ncbi:Carboxypeptidase Y inhibitor [Nakaseomyces bracarensis]|uniref:Carboxypeptidase Y inhibitor n=1 Tax=Nakaseomyces bracarensis TaxID=273131 RepID=A0ABR4NZ45_9SACH
MNYSVNTNQAIVDPLHKDEIIPDVIPDFTPAGIITAIYPGERAVTLGNELTPEQTSQRPDVHFTPNDPYKYEADDLFTLVLTDPDAPSRTDKKWSEFCHWVKTDIKLVPSPNVATTADLNNNGSTGIDYMGPGPPKDTGLHRYIFLLYKQNRPSSNFTKVKDRQNWGYGTPGTGVAKWAKENNLELLASNYFVCQKK